MGGFQFGEILNININIASIAFISTVLFLLFIEFLLGLLEYCFNENIQKILSKIYKELMIMGFVSLGLSLFNAGNDHIDVYQYLYI